MLCFRELAAQQAQQALQPSSISCPDMQQDLAAVAALHEELAQETQEQRLQLLGQVWQAQQYLGQQESVDLQPARMHNKYYLR